MAKRDQRLVFFGGKGGVGKTSSSAAYAAGLAEQGVKTLILSTDPAHSLGDALSESLTGAPREVADNLWAAEVDPAEALRELREGLQALDAKKMLEDLGLPGGTTAALGLNELSEVLESPPPGVDEITAIARTAALAEDYDVIVFDTAPTGHTLRLLEVPKFISSFIDRALSFRKGISGVLGMFNLGGNAVDDALDNATEQVQEVRDRIAWLASALKTPPGTSGTSAEFVVVTRPTPLDVAEAGRLVLDLRGQGISCKRLIVNQVMDAESSDAYWTSRVSGQEAILKVLREECKSRGLPMSEVADLPEALVGVPALGYLGQVAFDEPLPKGEVLLFGGKGGVGKTSMSSAMAVRVANEGRRVLVISTDPAHSLGDALDENLTEEARQLPSFSGAGELWAMEVDTAAAMSRFQGTVREALKRREDSGGIVGKVLEQLPMEDFVDLFDTLPPGSDEIVALVDVLQQVQQEKFDLIIIDTAPTGHALRLLSFPDFLERLADRVARLRDRFGWLDGGDSGRPDSLRSFQLRMIELQDLFTDPERTAFAVVTIPTKLALEETKRLFRELDDEDIRVGVVIANRIINPDQTEKNKERFLESQQKSLEALDHLARREDLQVTKLPYLDREIQGIYGLKYFSQTLADHQPA